MKELKVKGKDVKEAVELALKELNLNREQVEVEILNEGKKGFLGINSEEAEIIVREKIWGKEKEEAHGNKKMEEPKPANNIVKHSFDLKNYEMKFVPSGNTLKDAENILSQILNFSGFQYKINSSRYDEANKFIYIDFATQDSGLFLFDDARGLFSLQYILSSIINKNQPEKITIRLDTSEFWSRTEERLKRDVEKAINTIKRTGKPYRLRPMPSQFRKIVHNIVKDKYPDYLTTSEGEDKYRKVVIRPKK